MDLPQRPEPPPPRPPDGRAFERRFVLGFVLLLVGLLVAEVVRDYTPLKLSVLFFLGAWVPRIVIHEGGHALAAKLCGWRLHGVMLGSGAPVARFRIGGLPVAVGRIPLGGFASIAPTHLRQVRLRSAFVYFMGPGAEMIALGVIALVVGPERLLAAQTSLGMVAVQAVCAAFALGVFSNLVPHRVNARGDFTEAGSPSDGLGILLSFTRPRAALERGVRTDRGEPS